MNQKVLLILSIFIISAFAESERIAGGEIADLGDFPYHVKIEPSIGSFRRLCGGALIRYNWVITVAQCINNARDVIVRLGVVDRLSGPETAIFWVREREDIIVHPDYSGNPDGAEFFSDIGLIFLRDATEDLLNIVDENNRTLINTIALPPSNILNLDNIAGVVTGFGFYIDSEDALQSMSLRSAVMMTIPLQTCKDYHGTTRVTDGNFCTETNFSGRSTCTGDEGGPFVTLVNSIPTVIGLASTTFPQCTVGHPAIFTNLVSFYDWIFDNIDQPPVTIDPPTPTPPPDSGNNCNCICRCYTCPAQGIDHQGREPKTSYFWND